MTTAKKRRIFFLVLVAIVSIFVIVDSNNIFRESEYIVVPHGDHVHYMPHDRDPNVPVHSFPMVKPRPNEMITPDGRIVPRPNPMPTDICIHKSEVFHFIVSLYSVLNSLHIKIVCAPDYLCDHAILFKTVRLV